MLQVTSGNTTSISKTDPRTGTVAPPRAYLDSQWDNCSDDSNLSTSKGHCSNLECKNSTCWSENSVSTYQPVACTQDRAAEEGGRGEKESRTLISELYCGDPKNPRRGCIDDARNRSDTWVHKDETYQSMLSACGVLPDDTKPKLPEGTWFDSSKHQSRREESGEKEAPEEARDNQAVGSTPSSETYTSFGRYGRGIDEGWGSMFSEHEPYHRRSPLMLSFQRGEESDMIQCVIVRDVSIGS